MLRMLRCQRLIVSDQHVVRVLLLRRCGEIAAPRDDGFAVDDHGLIMRDTIVGINRRRHALVGQEAGGRIFLGVWRLWRIICTYKPNEGDFGRRGSKAMIYF